MKHLILLIANLLIFTSLQAQLRLHNGNFQSALAKAATQNKPVCVLIIPSDALKVPKGYINLRKDKSFASALNARFINLIPDSKDSEWVAFNSRFAFECCPRLVFIDTKGEVADRFFISFTDPQRNLRLIAQASQQLNNGRTLSWYDKVYKDGKRDTTFLKEYIHERQRLGIHLNHHLAEEYAEQLPLKSINTKAVSAFLLHTGLVTPLLYII